MPIKWESYNVNGCWFNTKSRDENRFNQNSGVSIVTQTMQVASTKDKHKDDPFILASQANPVFYVDDPINKHLSIVLSSNPRGVHTAEYDEVEEIEELSTPYTEALDSDTFDCLEATTGSYLRDDGVKDHVIKHSPPIK